MSDFLFSIPQASVPIVGHSKQFPVHRIYCVGRNYADHAREMGADPSRERPFFFTKPADALLTNNAAIPYPPLTSDLHHEVELVVALNEGGKNLSLDQAKTTIYGYAVGIDLTRRDLQAAAKAKGHPWDAAKAFDGSAPISAITPATQWQPVDTTALSLTVNGKLRQQGSVKQMIWAIDEVISALSRLFTLAPGDLIFTGTPAGVSALNPGDTLSASIDGLPTLTTQIVE